MSKSHGQGEGETRDRRLIREAKEEAFHCRRQVRREQPSPSSASKRQLATALADFRDVLWDYHGERALKTPWGEREVDVDVVDALLTETTSTSRSLNRRGSAAETVEVPLVETVSAEHLIRIGKELDAIAKELGFAAAAKDPVPNEEADMSDLRGLLKARGQEGALEKLPDHGKGEEGDGDE